LEALDFTQGIRNNYGFGVKLMNRNKWNQDFMTGEELKLYFVINLFESNPNVAKDNDYKTFVEGKNSLIL
jgi:hypothetical protein